MSTFPRIENINGIDHLVVALPMQEPTLSNSEKTLIVAKTNSPVKTELKSNNQLITYTGSAWIKRK